jgi:recombinational DNA repair protein (RecF pathway)
VLRSAGKAVFFAGNDQPEERGKTGCREEDTEDPRVQDPRVQDPRAEGLRVQDQAIQTIRTAVQDPTKSTVQGVGRSSSSKILHPLTKNYCAWNVSKSKKTIDALREMGKLILIDRPREVHHEKG